MFFSNSFSQHKKLIAIMLIDLFYLVIYLTKMNILQFTTYVFFIYTIFSIIKHSLLDYEYNHPSILVNKEEEIEKIINSFYFYLNSLVDLIKKGVFLENPVFSLKIILVLLVISHIGSKFSFDSNIVLILNLSGIIYSKRCNDFKNTMLRVVRKIVLDNLPKYQERK
jgi:hypothetical protein